MVDFSKEAVTVFNALADPTRYKIIQMLARKEEISCQDIARAFKLSRPALSNHFRVLNHAGLIEVRKEGVYHFFILNRAYLDKFIPSFAQVHGWFFFWRN